MSKNGKRESIIVMATLIVGAFLCIFSEVQMNIALPTVSREFGVPVTTAQWLTTGYMLVTGVFAPLAAFAMQRFGSKRTAIFAFAMSFVGMVIAAMSTGFELLLIGRLIQAVGAALIIPVMIAVIITLAPKDQFGKYNGIMMLVLMVAPAISPAISGFILATFNVRVLVGSVAPAMLVVLAVTAITMRDTIESRPVKLDFPSLVLSILGFGGLVYGVGNAASAGFAALETLAPMAIGCVTLAVYARRQLQLDTPLLNLRILRNGKYAYAVAMVIVMQVVLFGTILVGTIFLQTGWGMSPLAAALAMLPGGVASAVANYLAGAAYDKWELRAVPVGAACTAAGFIITASAIAFNAGVVVFAIGCAVFSFGIPFFMTSLNSFGLGSLDEAEYPDGSSINNTTQQVAGSLGTALFTVIIYNSPLLLGDGVTQTENGAFAAYLVMAVIASALLVPFFVQRAAQRRREAE